MDDPPFADAAERIQFSQAVSYLESGTPELIPKERVDAYVAKGLMRRDGDALPRDQLRRAALQVAHRLAELDALGRVGKGWVVHRELL